jgi:hypothetical protein
MCPIQLFQRFLHDQLGAQLHQRSQQVLVATYPVFQQFIDLVAHFLAWWYLSFRHGVWSFLPFRAGDCVCRRSLPHAFSFFRIILS